MMLQKEPRIGCQGPGLTKAWIEELREKPGVIQVEIRARIELIGSGGTVLYSIRSRLGVGMPRTILVIAKPVTIPITGLIGRKKLKKRSESQIRKKEKRPKKGSSSGLRNQIRKKRERKAKMPVK